MTQVATLVGKEVRTLFTSPIAYAVIAVFIVLSGYTFTVSLIVAKQATLVHIFFQSAVQLILLVPLITMRQFAEERRSGTLELLLTAPLRRSTSLPRSSSPAWLCWRR
jgi:ABC-2 type transport system permease protein